MKKSRIIVLFLALAAAAGAFVLASGSGTPPPAPVASLPPPPPPPPSTDDILVTARDLPLGHKIVDGDLAWQAWPKDSLPPAAIRKEANPKAIDDDKGAIVRIAMFGAEPVRAEKLIKGTNGFMSALLPSGKRAVAINIDSQGATTAGSFILPNDRVDVVRTFHPETKPGGPPAPGDSFQTDTLLSNVKVLAIGQNYQDKDGQPVVVGSNATLELEPEQAETVIQAQRTGQLSLVLRSVQDAHQATEGVTRQAGHSLSVVRYGTITQDTGR